MLHALSRLMVSAHHQPVVLLQFSCYENVMKILFTAWISSISSYALFTIRKFLVFVAKTLVVAGLLRHLSTLIDRQMA